MQRFEAYLFNKSTVTGVCLLFFASAYLMINFEQLVDYGSVASLAILAYSLPCFISLFREIGRRKIIIVLFVLGTVPVIVEALAIRTGFPYGHFTYSDRMGYLLFDTVPPSLALGYLPILIGSIAVASQFESKNRLRFAFIGTVINMLMDMVIDPASVSNGFWAWENTGIYYGVPIVNFLGWLLTGFIYINIYYQIAGENLPLSSRITTSLMYIISLWSSYLLQKSLYFLGILGIVIVIILLRRYWKKEFFLA